MFEDAEKYERFMGRWSAFTAPLLVTFSDLPNRGRVLDVGSGTGSLSFALAKMKPELSVVGIEPSREFIAYADSRNPVPKRASFVEGDAQQLQFPDASFESCVSLFAFNFIPDAQKA